MRRVAVSRAPTDAKVGGGLSHRIVSPSSSSGNRFLLAQVKFPRETHLRASSISVLAGGWKKNTSPSWPPTPTAARSAEAGQSL